MRQDYFFSLSSEVITLFSTLFLFRLAKHLWGTEGFAEYALTRRILSLIIPIVFVGLGISLKRYLAYHQARIEITTRSRYFLSGLVIMLFTSISAFIILIIFDDTFSLLFFDNPNYQPLILPIAINLLALSLHAVIQGYLIGMLRIRLASLWQVLTIGFLPIAAFGLFSYSVEKGLLALGAFMLIFEIGIISHILLYEIQLHAMDRQTTQELLGYGIGRVPGTFFFGVLFALPATFSSHAQGVEIAGQVAFAISVLNILGTAFAPVSNVIFPYSSELLGKGEIKRLRKLLIKLMIFVLAVGIAGTLFLELFADQVLQFYLGERLEETILFVRIIAIAFPPYSIYLALRDVLDAYYYRPVNSINLGAALLIYLCLSMPVILFDGNSYQILSAFVASLFVLGILSIVAGIGIFGLGPIWWRVNKRHLQDK
ncbi:MAG: hypothetical protein F9K27_14450 [Anaerolineae bacterium]|nr:MAG: hypothetical protein F9K27_14450 [Anaerolineae bacterium]